MLLSGSILGPNLGAKKTAKSDFNMTGLPRLLGDYWATRATQLDYWASFGCQQAGSQLKVRGPNMGPLLAQNLASNLRSSPVR